MHDTDLSLLPVSPIPLQPKHAAQNRRFQGIPGLEITPSGRLWATWYGGGRGEGPENYVVLSTSTDGGGTWSEELVIDPPQNVRAYDSTLWIDPQGRLWWFWAQCASVEVKDSYAVYDGRAGVWAVVAEDLERPLWSAPRRIANGVMMNKPSVLSNGEWALPTAVWNDVGNGTALPELLHERFSSITISADQGGTFTRRGGADVRYRSFDEHMIVELKDGRLWMLVRTEYGIGQSFSKDGGISWTPGYATPLGGPGSRFYIRRLRSGRLLLVNHVAEYEHPTERRNMTAWLSEDDGKTWKGGLLLDGRKDVSYPDGTQTADGTIWIIYDHARYKGGDILLARFREEDVLAGICVSSEARLRIQVSRYPYTDDDCNNATDGQAAGPRGD